MITPFFLKIGRLTRKQTAVLQTAVFILFIMVSVLLVAGTAVAEQPNSPESPENNTYQTLPFSQNWSNTSLITTNDAWSGIPGIIGYLGDYTASSPANVDPRSLLDDYSSTAVDVIANQANPNTQTSGGVAEFDTIANPVIALQGSGTADAPFILIHLDTTGFGNIRVQYNLRDIDGAIDDAAQQVALHYRIGTSGTFTNVPAAYVADATTGPSLATLVTPINVTLPPAANNQSQLQLRIMTTNATGSDEWVGIDDISVTGTLLTYDTINPDGDLSDWNTESHKLGTNNPDGTGLEYFLTWDETYLYVAYAGGGTNDQYNVAVDVDPNDIGLDNSGTTNEYCGATFGADGKPDYVIQKAADNNVYASQGTTSWVNWTPANSTAVKAGTPNQVEFRLSWGDLGLTDRNKPVGIYLWACNNVSELWASYPPTNPNQYVSGRTQPEYLSTRIYLPTTDNGRLPRVYAQHKGDETQFNANGSFSLLNGFAQIEVTNNGGTGCNFKIAVQGNAASDTNNSAVRRHYTIEPTGCAPTANMTLRYLDGDFAAPDERNGYADTNTLKLFRWNGSAWVDSGGTANDTANTVAVTGISAFSPWTFGTGTGPTAVSLQAFTSAANPTLPLLLSAILVLLLLGGTLFIWQHSRR